MNDGGVCRAAPANDGRYKIMIKTITLSKKIKRTICISSQQYNSFTNLKKKLALLHT